MNRRWLIGLLVVALALVGIYLGIGGYIGSQLTIAERKPIATSPAAYGVAFEDVRVPARDGTSLAGWFIPAAGSDRALVMVHGVNSNRTAEFDGRFVEAASRFHDHGYNILMIDLRGHGESEGERFSMGAKERWDVLGAVDWLKARGMDKIGVLAVSLGAASAVEAAADPDGGQAIQALATDSMFGDVYGVLEREFPKRSGLPVWFLPGAVSMTSLLYGVNLRVRPMDDLRAVPAPVMLMSGTGDELVPQWQFPATAQARPDATVWVLPGAEHARLYTQAPDEYVQRVTAFCDEHLGTTRAGAATGVVAR